MNKKNYISLANKAANIQINELKKIKRMESTIMANVGDEEHVRDGLDKLGSFGWELVSIDIQIIEELDKTIQSYFISRPYGKDEFIFKRKKSK